MRRFVIEYECEYDLIFEMYVVDKLINGDWYIWLILYLDKYKLVIVVVIFDDDIILVVGIISLDSGEFSDLGYLLPSGDI